MFGKTKTLDERMYDADRAREVLENEAFQGAFNDIKAEINEQWKQSPARDEAGREKLYQLLKLADKLELVLKSSLDSGRLAREQLKHEQTLMARAKALASLQG